ncbi:MAG: hypothetical protein GY941_23995 [Planctomycetes bacterium]|nr:hypothetical protein [Planctomycetota bacterium]
MNLLDSFKSLGYEVIVRNGNIKLSFAGKGKPDKGKVLPFLEELKSRKNEAIEELQKSVPLVVEEPENSFCQKCLSNKWERLCWGTDSVGKKGFSKFCLRCRAYPEIAKSERTLKFSNH